MTSKLLQELKGAYAEFIASLFFVFFGAGSVCGALSATSDQGPVEPINYAVAFGFSISILAFAIGDVSGGHINPAVTLALAVTKNITPSRAVLYVFFQMLGGLSGGALLYGAVGKDNYTSGIALAPDTKPAGGFALEFMGTLLLIFAVFNVAVWSGKPLENDIGGSTVSALAPIPIGWAVLVAHLTLGPFTGCGINPMRGTGRGEARPLDQQTSASPLRLTVRVRAPTPGQSSAPSRSRAPSGGTRTARTFGSGSPAPSSRRSSARSSTSRSTAL